MVVQIGGGRDSQSERLARAPTVHPIKDRGEQYALQPLQKCRKSSSTNSYVDRRLYDLSGSCERFRQRKAQPSGCISRLGRVRETLASDFYPDAGRVARGNNHTASHVGVRGRVTDLHTSKAPATFWVFGVEPPVNEAAGLPRVLSSKVTASMASETGSSSRLTIDQLSGGLFAPPDQLARVADRGRRRHRTLFRDFDTRATSLAAKIQEHWDESVKTNLLESKARTVAQLRQEFGDLHIDRKVRDFTDMGVKPFSIIAYHNALFEQVRVAFASGAYYPALVGACTLGERILNHLVIDLREDFRATPQYKKVYNKSSFDDWQVAISTLRAWHVLLPDVAEEFEKMAELRHRSIHFNVDTYARLRDDALTAIAHLRTIIDRQFGTFGAQPWFLDTPGACFIKREYETRPFIRRYFLPQCPFVGVLSGFDKRLSPIDFHDYGDGELTDQQFCDAFNHRDPAAVATG